MFDLRAVFIDLVCEDGTIIWFGDTGGLLHHPRGQTDFASDEFTARCDATSLPFVLNSVGILHLHVRVLRGQQGNHRATVLSRSEIISDLLDLVLFQHDPQISFWWRGSQTALIA